MCGIAGYVGKRDAVGVITEALKKLSYRGYDSAGIATVSGLIKTVKCAGKIECLEEKLKETPLPSVNMGIGHTRWATHGAVTDENSHPHGTADVTIVHNGIIENYLLLKQKLISFGYTFKSETDSEVGALLIDYFYKKTHDPMTALREATGKFHGSYAIAAIFKDYPNTIFTVRRESPILVGVGADEIFVASDIPAFLSYTKRYFRLGDGEIAKITPDGFQVFDRRGDEVKKNLQHAPFDAESAEKGGFSHFMRKEISEESGIVSRLISMYSDGHGLPFFDLNPDIVNNTSHITIIGCGTAYHAGLYLKYLLEKLAKIRTECHIASEFRYTEPLFDKDELVIVISQSGETADTLSCLRAVKALGVRVLGIVNVVGSAIATEADEVIYTHAGVEIAVASTKAYTAQCTVAALLATYFASARSAIEKSAVRDLSLEIKKLPDAIMHAIRSEDAIIEVAEEIKDAENLFFIGRRADHIAAIEGSLKLKEISYIHSEAYPAGELKHGTISLITDKTPVVALFGDREMIPKMLSNLKEAASRGAKSIAISSPNKDIAEVADIMVDMPRVGELFFPIAMASMLQLLAYHTALKRGCDVDQPRNLAKSVTVE